MWQLARESASAEEFQQRLKPAKVQDPRLEQIEKNRGGSQPSHVAQSGENEDALPQEAEGLLGNPGSVPSDLPPGPIQPLSRDLAHLHARNNVIIVTWANYHFVDFALNWADHVLSHGIGNFLVGAMDAETAEVLSSRGIPVFAMYDPASSNSTGLTKGDFGWGSPTFHKMGRQKVDLALAFLSYELDLCLCDVDTVWIKGKRILKGFIAQQYPIFLRD